MEAPLKYSLKNFTMDPDKLTLRTRLFTAFRINIALVAVVIAIVISFNEGKTPYLNVGWHPDLFILGCNIDTRGKYICLILLLGLLEAVDVYINDTIYPYISNNVRNNNVKHIKEFSKNELRLLTNGSYVMSSIKYTLLIMVSISQIDISLIKVLFGEITCLFTTDIQLSEKTYGQEYVPIATIDQAEIEIIVLEKV